MKKRKTQGVLVYGPCPIKTWELSTRNKEIVRRSKRCGCFCCCGTFPPSDVQDFTDNGKTALCPVCSVDSVIPMRRGMDIQFLNRMNRIWFGRVTPHSVVREMR